MSYRAVALKGAASGVELIWPRQAAALHAVKMKLLAFLNKLPDRRDDVDPATFRRLPPY